MFHVHTRLKSLNNTFGVKDKKKKLFLMVAETVIAETSDVIGF